ncbi:MAG: dienelactone hydrolase family protein [Pseudomonadota bacterium]
MTEIDPDTLLKGPRVAPRNPRTTALVILLHGYGADGNDLAGLAGPLAGVLPGAAFRAPNAPEICRVNRGGRQWFPIPWIDGASEQEMMVSFSAAVDLLDRYVTAAMAAEGVGPAQTALVGFSQGTMMSLHVAPRRPQPVAGVVGFSGRLLVGERLGAEMKSKPPVLLVHGDRDDVIPVAALEATRQGLASAGVEVIAHVSPGTPHGIAPDGLGLAASFLREKLGTAVG